MTTKADNIYGRIMQKVESYTYYNHLLAEHIRNVRITYGDNGTVFVYKGFPRSFMEQIQQVFDPVSQRNVLLPDGKLNLEVIKSDPLAYVLAIRQIANNHGAMWYEEFVIFSRNINPNMLQPKKFVIVDNNFFRYYPNPSNHPFGDVEELIDAGLDFTPDDLFDEFYTDSTIVDGVKYVQYPDVDGDDWTNVTKINFFSFDNQEINSTVFYEGMNMDGFVQFQIENPSWFNLKYKFYSGAAIEEPVKLLIDTAALKDQRSFRELLILQQILQAAAVKFDFCYRKDSYADYYRPELLDILNEYWKSQSFRALKIYDDPDISTSLATISQGAICEHVVKQCESSLDQKLHEDIFLTAPTGAGKSVLFQIPAIYISNNYDLVTIVVSPLKALMLDQVTALKEERGYDKVGFINSDISLVEREDTLTKIKSGDISIIYLSPELLLSYDLKYFVGNRNVGLMVIDEAHLVTTWGRDFRVDYWFLGNYIRKARKYLDASFPVFAVTATAVYNGPNDMVFDTINSLNMQNCKKFIGYVRRDDVTFDIRKFTLPTNSHTNDKVNQTAKIIRSFIENNQKAIVYFPWISTLEDVLRMMTPQERLSIGEYHSRAGVDERNRILRDFKSNRINVVLATKAFGMGVDISDIKEVYHHAPSGTIADYVQEIGRVARKADIQGIATIDFHPKDLKFSRILFGLSSLKQWQVKMVLEKLHNIYKINNRRNFLISVDDFAYIFPNNEEPEQKVKSALLVLEKDLLARFRYNVLIVRPKSLFSTVYIRINNTEKENFLSKYSDFVSEERSSAGTGTRVLNSSTVIMTDPDKNNSTTIYKVQLDKIWEKYYPEVGFPDIKRQFFTKELFNDFETIYPQLKLNVLFNEDVASTLGKLTEMFQVLEKIMNSFGGGYFSKDNLYYKLQEELNNEVLSRNLSNLLIAMYTDNNNFGRQGNSGMMEGSFIQKRFNSGKSQDEYRIISAAFVQVKARSRQRFQSLFGGNSDERQIKFISADSDKNRESIKLAYIMEVFNLCTYEIIGGEQPQIFIRINDPLKIARLARSRNYANNIIAAVEQRFGLNVRLMTDFFLKEGSNEARWDFIERYFMGKTEEEIANSL